MGVERKIYYLSLFFASVGLLSSIYLTVTKYTSLQLACPDTGVIDCTNVLTSQYASLYGVPNVILGVVFFVVMFAVITLVKNKDAFVILSGIGMAFVLYYIYAEYMVRSICIYCTVVHISTIALLILALINSNGKD